MKRLLAVLLSACFSFSAWGLDLDQLQAQLCATPVVRGQFVQEKHLRALPQPLVSRGDFTLANGRGLLWLLRSPLTQDLRITAQGLARRAADGLWVALPQQAGGARENRLFLAVLAGDTAGLGESFDLVLTGDADDWLLTMTPRAPLLRQIFSRILIKGGKLVDRIDLYETQGDSTILRMIDAHADAGLAPDEQRAFGD